MTSIQKQSSGDEKEFLKGGISPGFSPWVGKMPWGRAWQPTPVCLPGEPHGQSLVGTAYGVSESDTPERLEHLSSAAPSSLQFSVPLTHLTHEGTFKLFKFVALVQNPKNTSSFFSSALDQDVPPGGRSVRDSRRREEVGFTPTKCEAAGDAE